MISFRTATLAVLAGLAGFICLGVYYAQLTGGRSLDFIFTQSSLIKTIAIYTPADIARHIWGTKVLDTAFPILYGGATAIVLGRYKTGRTLWLLLGMLVFGIGFDYAENTANLMLLSGGQNHALHVFFTWAKFLGITAPIVLALKAYLGEIMKNCFKTSR